MDEKEVVYKELGKGSSCPKCELGKGLREVTAMQIMLTGWEHYDFLHCDICGANFVGKDGEWRYMHYLIPKFDE